MMLLAAILMLTTAETAPVCSFVPTTGPKRPGAPYFLGRARGDTVAAGGGRIETTEGEGHFGPSFGRAIHGQVVEVSRIGGVGLSPRVRAARRVVIVPWDYDAACQPLPWSGTYRWLRPRVTRFFHPQLRDEAFWYRGMPTYDAFVPQFAAFPSPQRDPVFPAADSVVTPTQLFDFYERMPDDSLVESGETGQLESLRRWTEAHPGISAAWPIPDLIYSLVGTAVEGRMSRVKLPMLGTYRVDISLPMGGLVHTLYARTADRPDGVVTQLRSSDTMGMSSPWAAERYVGVKVRTMIARTLDSLPDTLNWKMQDSQPWELAWPDSTADSWRASILVWSFLMILPDDSLTHQALDLVEQQFDRGWVADTLPAFDGEFRRSSAGTYIYRGQREVGGKQPLSITATWLNPQTFAR